MVSYICSHHMRISSQLIGFAHLDHRHQGYKKWSRFFEAFGINPLFMYVLGAVLSILIGSIYVTYGGASMTLKGMIYNEWLVPLFKDETFASLIFALLFIGVNWIIGYVLYKKKIYIKI